VLLVRIDCKRIIFKLEVTDQADDGGAIDIHFNLNHSMTGSTVLGVIKQRNQEDFDVSLDLTTFALWGIQTDLKLKGVISLGFIEYGYQVSGSLFGQLNNITFQYNLKFDRQFICPQFDLFHELQETRQAESSGNNDDLFSFKSTLKTINCKDSQGINSALVIDINLDSKNNPLIQESKLRQLFVFERDSGNETMSMTSPIIDINVTADWKDLNDKNSFRSTKKAIFMSKKILEWLPSFEIEYLRTQEQLILKLVRAEELNNKRDEL
jgi:hypothetical protein